MSPSMAEVDQDSANNEKVQVAPLKSATSNEMEQTPIQTGVESTPVTILRTPYIPQNDDPLIDAGVARVNLAPSTEHPEGTTENDYASKHADQTVLQQHCAYWDPDNDGIIWPQDTYAGCRKWGWNPLFCVLVAAIINGALSYLSVPGWLPDPFFRLWNKNMHKNRHGSTSQAYDNEGRYRPQAFEDIFAKYDRDHKGGLSKGDVWNFLKGQRLAFDFWGGTATTLEWIALYLLIWPDDGVMRKEDIRGAFDGSLFYKKAEEHARRVQAKNKSA